MQFLSTFFQEKISDSIIPKKKVSLKNKDPTGTKVKSSRKRKLNIYTSPKNDVTESGANIDTVNFNVSINSNNSNVNIEIVSRSEVNIGEENETEEKTESKEESNKDDAMPSLKYEADSDESEAKEEVTKDDAVPQESNDTIKTRVTSDVSNEGMEQILGIDSNVEDDVMPQLKYEEDENDEVNKNDFVASVNVDGDEDRYNSKIESDKEKHDNENKDVNVPFKVGIDNKDSASNIHETSSKLIKSEDNTNDENIEIMGNKRMYENILNEYFFQIIL